MDRVSGEWRVVSGRSTQCRVVGAQYRGAGGLAGGAVCEWGAVQSKLRVEGEDKVVGG